MQFIFIYNILLLIIACFYDKSNIVNTISKLKKNHTISKLKTKSYYQQIKKNLGKGFMNRHKIYVTYILRY